MKYLSKIVGSVGITCLIILSTGCRSATLYHGVVMDQETGKPLSGIEVQGHYLINAEFAPSLDGMFTRHSKTASTVTDEYGKFSITLGGYSRSVAVYHAIYATSEVALDKIDPSQEIVLKLHRTSKEEGPNNASHVTSEPAP